MDAGTIPKICPFCGKQYRDPKLLPCFHILCRQCVSDLFVINIEQVKCPVEMCRRDILLENKDPDTLPDALPVYYRRDVESLKSKISKGETRCTLCWHSRQVSVEAVALCKSCNSICASCVSVHEREIQYHEVVSFLELSQTDTDHIHHDILRRQRSSSFTQQRIRCKDHKKEFAHLYCIDCSSFVCQTCISDKHGNHTCMAPESAAAECKRNLVEKMPNVRLVHKRLAGGLHDVQQTVISVEDQKTLLTSSIEHTFSRLTNILVRRKQDLVLKLSQISDEKLKNLQLQKIELEKISGEFMRLEHYIESTFEMSTDVELLRSFNFIQERSHEILQHGSRLEVQPVEAANMAIKNTGESQLRDLCQKNVSVILEQASPSSCSAEGNGLKRAETEKHAYFSVNVVDKNLKPCSSLQNVLVKLKCVDNDFVSLADIMMNSTRKYEVSYCPQFRGEHRVFIEVNGQSIPGSPYLVNVVKHPLKLGQSQGIICDVTGPRGIAINQAGNLVVTEWNGHKIVELDKIGRRIREFGEGQVNFPASITVGEDGSMYVCDGAGETSSVVKFSNRGGLIKKVGKEGTQNSCEFSNPRGVRVSPKNEIWVCDRDNHRIQVFDRNLNFIRIIDLQRFDMHLEHKPKPNDTAFDTAGNFFVADYANHCILCFGPSEEFLSSFAGNPSNSKILSGPECIVLDLNGYLYVSESGNHRISIFTLSGELVKTVGVLGRSEGELRFPMGIAVDKNGSVFVCELLNNRIQMF